MARNQRGIPKCKPHIEQCSPSPRTPNIHDVAAAVGLHKSSVSLALSGKGNLSQKTRARVEAVAKEMGYRPNPLAQRLATNPANELITLCARTLDVGVTTEKILLIEKGLSGRGLETPIYTLSDNGRGHEEAQAEQMRRLCRQQPRAIVCSAQAIHESVFPELEHYQRKGGIVVAYDVEVPLECDQVLFDREDNAYQAARYLIQRGHRNLGLALSTPRYPNGELFFNQNARLRGFARALDEADIELRREWIFEQDTYEIGGAHLAERFLSLEKRPTGLCIVNDYMALGFMSAALCSGLRIPDDVSVVGHDNQQVAAFCPIPLTSATHPTTEIAASVVDLLIARLNGLQEPARKITIGSTIVERESVAPPLS